MFSPVMEVAEDLDIRVSLDVAVRMGQIGCNPEMWEKFSTLFPALGLSCDPSHWLWMGMLPVEDVIRDFAGKWYFADERLRDKRTYALPPGHYRQLVVAICVPGAASSTGLRS